LRIPIDRVRPGANARGDLGDVTDLATSMRTIGQQDPLIVADNGDGTFTVFDGHRRLAACDHAGLDYVDAVIRNGADHDTRITRQLAMHALARAFDPIAEAHALHELVFVHKRRLEDVARAVGHAPRWVSDRLSLLMLDERERAEVSAGRMPVRYALATVAQRRAERDHREARPEEPAQRASAAQRPHCASCSCFQEAV